MKVEERRKIEGSNKENRRLIKKETEEKEKVDDTLCNERQVGDKNRK